MRDVFGDMAWVPCVTLRCVADRVLAGVRLRRGAEFILGLGLALGLFGLPAWGQLPTAVGWTALPASTSLEGSGKCPPNGFGGDPYPFADTCQNVIRSWNGAIADTTANQLIIWGGGHTNYYGNEIYSLSLTANPIALTRVKDPTVPTNYANAANCVEGIPPDAANAPNSREDYGGLAFIPGPYRMMILDGSLACTNGDGSNDTWTIGLGGLSDSSSWVNEGPTLTGIRPNNDGNGPYGNVAAYDPNSGLVFVSDSEAIYTYDWSTNTYNRITSAKGFTTGIYLSGAIDPTRKLFVLVGACSNGSCSAGNGVFVADISDPTTTTQQDWTAATLTDSTCAEFLDGGVNPINSSSPGITFDSVANDFVAWPNQGNSVYILTPDVANQQLTCQKLTYDNGPPNSSHANNTPNTSYGTFGRFQYFPGLDVFVLVNDWNIPAYILRLRSPSDFTIAAAPASATLAPGGSTTYTISTEAVGSFSGTVDLSVSGLPDGATGTLSASAIAAGSSATFSVATATSIVAGTYTLTITGTSGSLTNTASATLEITGPATFTLSAAPGSASVTAGNEAAYTVSTEAVNGFSGTVDLSVSGLPTGASGTFSPSAVAVGSGATLSVTTESSTAAGTYTLTIAGASGGLSVGTSVTLIVTAVSSGGTIAFVQGAYSVPQSSVGSVSASFTAGQTAGNLNVVLIGWNDTVATISSVTDAAGNTYHLASGPTQVATNATQALYYAANVIANAGGTNAVTVTFNVGAAYPDLRILEYAGASQSNPLDVVGGASATSSTASVSLTTTNADDLIVAGDYIQTVTPSAGSGFTARIVTQPDSDIAEDESVTATGTYAASSPLGTAGWWVMNAAAFRVGSGASQPPPPPPPPPPSNINYVQGAYSEPQGSVDSATATYAGAQTSGDLNIVVIGWNDTTATVRSVEDGKGNVYSLATGPVQLSGVATQSIWYSKNIVGGGAGATTVRVSFNGSATSPNLRIVEYSGASTTDPIDAIGGASGTGVTASASLSAATSNANDLIFASDFVQTVSTGAGAGFTSRIVTSPVADIVEDEPVAAVGIYSASAGLESGWWLMQVVAIK